jgi:endosialidase-like protein
MCRQVIPGLRTAGSSNYIQNTNSQQSASFNINGDGKAGGTLSATIVSATMQYNLGNSRLLSAAGSNTFVGFSAGASNQGGGNSFFGFAAGAQNTGSANAFFGGQAGAHNTSGSNNAFFGVGGGLSNTTGSANSFFGRDAGFANTSGLNNSFFGFSAGAFNTDGTDNSFFGRDAGAENIHGDFNSFFGRSAGAKAVGYSNSFFGNLAGAKTLGGNSNSFFGGEAGATNTTGEINSFFGWRAGFGNTTGKNNTFFGGSTGGSNTTGDSNTAVGYGAGMASANLDHATAIGADSFVATSNTIALGRSNGADSVRVPGTLTLVTLGSPGIDHLCRNASNQISTCSSSLRYKTNIQPFINGLSVLNRLRPITFDWKQGGMHDLGFGGEDVAAVEPLLVTRNDKGEVEGVKVRPHHRRAGQRRQGTAGTDQATTKPDRQFAGTGLPAQSPGGCLQVSPQITQANTDSDRKRPRAAES